MALSPRCLAARLAGYDLLSGDGIEIGAFHEPADLPPAARVRYVDAISKAEAMRLFPEVDAARLVEPSVLANLDRDGLRAFADESLDFVVASHVLEHLANPLYALTEIFRVLRPGGRAAVAIPDKRFTFDRDRQLTPFLHLWEDYLLHRTESSDEHYLDFLFATTSFVRHLPPTEWAPHVAGARARREHAHVWDSAGFQETVRLTLSLTGQHARALYESLGDTNGFEYFGVWEKL